VSTSSSGTAPSKTFQLATRLKASSVVDEPEFWKWPKLYLAHGISFFNAGSGTSKYIEAGAPPLTQSAGLHEMVQPRSGCFDAVLLRRCLSAFAALWLAAALAAVSQQVQGPEKRTAESEIVFEGGASVGNIQIFAFAEDRRINPIGFEYDRHSWGGLLTARVDYVAEVLPVVLMSGPAKYDIYSRPLTTARETQYGAGISPVGVRLLWRRNKTFKPYLMGKGGILYFKDRALSPLGSHLNFSAQFGGGMETRLSPHLDLRLGVGDFHFSNGDIVARNPGIDFMTFSAGLGYRFGRQRNPSSAGQR
jgi:opacity protein-like surface antigen